MYRAVFLRRTDGLPFRFPLNVYIFCMFVFLFPLATSFLSSLGESLSLGSFTAKLLTYPSARLQPYSVAGNKIWSGIGRQLTRYSPITKLIITLRWIPLHNGTYTRNVNYYASVSCFTALLLGNL